MTTLASEIEAHLEQSGPTAATELVRILRRRRDSVFAVLHDDSRFEQTGAGRGSRWRIASQEPRDGDGGRMGTIPSGDEGTDMGSDPDAGEGPVSRCVNPTLHRGNNATYLHNGVRLCVICDAAPSPPALTVLEWARGEGSELQRERFVTDYERELTAALRRMTPEEREVFTSHVRKMRALVGSPA